MKKRQKRKDQEKQRIIATERIGILLETADRSALGGNLVRANRYVELARNVSMKTNVRIPRDLKRKFCKHCYSYLLPAKTSKNRINSKERRVEVECFNCTKKMYYPIG